MSFLYFDKSFFAQQTYLERLFAVVKSSNHYDAIKSMTKLIGEADKADDYIDYILDKEEYVQANTICRKKLTHTFYHSQYEYYDEQEEYSNMIKRVFGRASEFIKHCYLCEV